MDYQHWYAAFVATGSEESVKAHMESELAKSKNTGVSLFIPKIVLYEVRDRVKIPVSKLMFPGYVLVGTDDIALAFESINEVKGFYRFLRDEEGGFQELALSEISRLVYMADADGTVGESDVVLDENDRIVVLAGPLKGFDGYIKKYNSRRGRVWVDFLLGTERHRIPLSVRIVERDTRSDDEWLLAPMSA